jgi:hypothetical protein
MRTTISKISLRELGAQAQAGFVEQDQLRRGHQRARDGQHLLLAARQQPGVLAPRAPSGSGSSRRRLFDVAATPSRSLRV